MGQISCVERRAHLIICLKFIETPSTRDVLNSQHGSLHTHTIHNTNATSTGTNLTISTNANLHHCDCHRTSTTAVWHRLVHPPHPGYSCTLVKAHPRLVRALPSSLSPSKRDVGHITERD